jgi:hypothetical protein
MRANAKKTLALFVAGKSGAGDSKRTISTDGTRVYSYRMPIAIRTESGQVAIVAYSDAPSNTTRSHIRACQVTFPDAVTLAAAIPR